MASIKSRYEKDVHPDYHANTCGSYWKEDQWGYKCCYSFIKENYSTRETSKATNCSVIWIITKDNCFN